MTEIPDYLFDFVKRRLQYEYTDEFDSDIKAGMADAFLQMEQSGITYFPTAETDKGYPTYALLMSAYTEIALDPASNNNNITNDIFKYTNVLINFQGTLSD